MASVADPARRFRRSRWPDIILVVGVLALAATGVFALWGDDWFHKDVAKETPVQHALPSTGGT